MSSHRTPAVASAAADPGRHAPDSPYAWWRQIASVLISTIGGVGLWSVVVAMPAVQAEFAVARAEASLPYTAAMLGLMLGGVLLGRVSDRFGVMAPVIFGTLSLCLGYILSGFATNLW